MKILYLSCHAILEYDEVSLFTELGHEVFSASGAYQDPTHPTGMRPEVENAERYDHLISLALQGTRENLHQELIDWADVIVVMHIIDWIAANWDKMRQRTVVWRSIGQSSVGTEMRLEGFRKSGLKIVRYSPLERDIQCYVGEDALIRFYKDPEEWKDWNGDKECVITVGQSINKVTRIHACRPDVFEAATTGLPRAVYGSENQDCGDLWGGYLSYEELKAVLRDNRVFFYTGTQPASYTLGFVEAFMTGIPVVAIGKESGQSWLREPTYEVPLIIENGVNGFCSDDVSVLRANVALLLGNKDEARRIGEAGRETAIGLFGKEKIKKQWGEFLKSV